VPSSASNKAARKARTVVTRAADEDAAEEPAADDAAADDAAASPLASADTGRVLEEDEVSSTKFQKFQEVMNAAKAAAKAKAGDKAACTIM
jgi:hypothetical protein